LSRLAGESTVRHSHRTFSSGNTSVSEPEVSRPLITPDEVRRLGADEVLIFTRGHPAIRARRLEYHRQEYFQRLAANAVPKTSDRIITARPSEDRREKGQGADSGVLVTGPSSGRPGEELRFLGYGANREAKARTGREELV
jgi:type IV secretory pathway TraG/TraD family ATPase VirD4